MQQIDAVQCEEALWSLQVAVSVSGEIAVTLIEWSQSTAEYAIA